MWCVKEVPFGVSWRDQEDLNCSPVFAGCQTGVSFACDKVMSPKAAQFYSDSSPDSSDSSSNSSAHGLSARRVLSAGLSLDLGAPSEPSPPA